MAEWAAAAGELGGDWLAKLPPLCLRSLRLARLELLEFRSQMMLPLLFWRFSGKGKRLAYK